MSFIKPSHDLIILFREKHVFFYKTNPQKAPKWGESIIENFLKLLKQTTKYLDPARAQSNIIALVVRLYLTIQA